MAPQVIPPKPESMEMPNPKVFELLAKRKRLLLTMCWHNFRERTIHRDGSVTIRFDKVDFERLNSFFPL